MARKASTTNTKAEAAAKTEDKPSGRGRAVILPDGERRVDYIQRRYYDDGAKRAEIRKEIAEMTDDESFKYQIVFAATKTEEDPRVAKAAAAKEKETAAAEKAKAEKGKAKAA